jgi:hypothetical protein
MTTTRRSGRSTTRVTSSSRPATPTTVYFAETRRAFPDQRNELIALHHADDHVIVEVDVLGTHLGPLRALPPTGRAFRCRGCAHFIFDGDRLLCERAYSTSSRSCASSGSRTTRDRSRGA